SLRVLISFAPRFSNCFCNFFLTASVTSFSTSPLPDAPGSLPPWPASTATVNPFKSFFAGGFGSVGGVVVTGLSDNCFDWTYPVRFPLNVSLVISYHEPLFAWTTTFVFCDAQPAAVLLASGFER